MGTKLSVLLRVAHDHGVKPSWLRLVSEGTLDDPKCVEALRAANTPDLWALVSPAIQAALFLPEAEMKALGGTRDDLLVAVAEHGLESVRTILEIRLDQHKYDLIDRGRAALDHELTRVAALPGARAKRREKADEQAQAWASRLKQTPKHLRQKERKRLAAEAGLKPGALESRLKRFRKRQTKV